MNLEKNKQEYFLTQASKPCFVGVEKMLSVKTCLRRSVQEFGLNLFLQ